MAIKSFLSENGFSVGSIASTPVEVVDSSGNVTGASLRSVASGTAYISINSTGSGSKELQFMNNGSVVGYLWHVSGYIGLGGGSSSNSLFVDPATGNVGIGTTGPSVKFDVTGSDPRMKISSSTDTGTLTIGQWDGVTNRIESANRKLLITSYTNGISLGGSGSEHVQIASGGALTSTVSTSSPIYYDSANSSFYCDPAGTSSLAGATLSLDPASDRSAITRIWSVSRGENLVTNGSGLMGSNYNFSGFTFDAAQTHGGAGSFLKNVAYGATYSDEAMPVDIEKNYRMVVWARSGEDGGTNYNASNYQYAGVTPLDIDGNLIDPFTYSKYPGATDTTLAVALNTGATTMTVTSAAGWANTGSQNYQRQIVWYGYTNSKGYTYPNYTYTRNVSYYNVSAYQPNGMWAIGGISGNVITLTSPWPGPNLPAGTAVRNCNSGGTFKYITVAGAVPNTWTRYEGYIGGIDTNGEQLTNKFPYGTAFIKLLFLFNYHGAADNNIRYSDVWFSETSSRNLEPATSSFAGVVSTGNQSFTGDKSFSGAIYASSFYNVGDTANRFVQGSLVLRNTSPTIYFRDTDNNSAMIHVNSNIFYVLRGANDTETWSQVNGVWPLEINLTTNNATFGGNLTVSGTGTSTFGGTLSVVNGSTTGILKLQGANSYSSTEYYDASANRKWTTGLDGSNNNYYWARSDNATAAVFTQTSNFLLGTTTDSGNGRFQLATHTTSAGGIGFGTDTSLYRDGTGYVSLYGPNADTTFRLWGGATQLFRITNSSTISYVQNLTGSLQLASNGITALTLDSSQSGTLAGNYFYIGGGTSFYLRATGAGNGIWYGNNVSTDVNYFNVRNQAGSATYFSVDNGKTSVLQSTVSSSTTTGALVVSGGVGIAGALNVGGTITGSVAVSGIPALLFNNFGEGHSTRASFDATTPSYDFGFRFVQGNTNGPGTGGNQFYSWYIGLGSQYPATGAGSYGAMFAVDRGGNPPYLSVRFNEANAFSTWRKIAAGKADVLTTARNIAGVSFDGSADITLTGQNISTSTSTAANDLEVAKYLRWKNYGNNHILIDASQGTSPSGTAIDKVTPSFPINSTTGSNTWGENISLMGWNGSNTYGVRVDRARVIDNQANSATVTATSSNTASQIVLRDGSGNFSAGRIDASSVYDINDTAYFLDPASSTTSLRVAGALKQGSDYAHPNVEWSTQGASTGMVVIKLPGTSANYGMIHAVIDIYEYDSATNVCTIYIGGHNWSGQWYNYGANVIGDTNKAVRVGFKDGQYCIVIGSAASSWSFGQVRLRKIQNGTYYSNNLDVGGTYTISQTATESFTWVSGEMRTLKTPQDFYAGGAVSALRLVSTTTTGTAPLTVASTTLVTNLNADLLDGYHASTSNTANTVVLRDGSGNFNAGTIYANLTSSIDQGIVAQNNGNGSQWYGRILSKNSTSGKAAFLGTYGASAVGVFAHNNALDTWTDLYVNTVDGSTGGTVRMPATVLINGSQVIHAGNYTSYSPSLTGTGASGSWPISISGSASSITGTYSGSISSSQVTTALGYSPAPRYVGTAANVSSAAYTCAFTVSGNALASSIRFTVQGTAGNVVVNSTIDVSVNHYQDIVITSQSGIYTVLTVRVVSNNDEAFAVLLTTNSVNAATLNIEVFPFNSESVTFTTTNPFSGATLTHQCDPGTSTSATGGNSGDLRVAGSIFQAGNQVLHAGNYNSYSPTLTGTGASGTWGISISGNADTATSADKIDGVAFRNTGSNSGTDADSLNSNGITYVNTNISLLGQTDGALYSQAYNSDWQHQIYGDYRTGQIVVRGKRGDLGTWQSWRTVLDSSNYTSYVNNGTLTLNVSGTGLSGSTSFTANQSGNTTFTVTSNATSANTGGTIVARDGSGNFSAGTITANSITGLLYAPRNTVYNNLGNPSADEKALFHGQFNNKLRFIAPYLQEESTNGSTWTASSRATSQQLADLMIGEGTGTSFTAIPAPGTGNAGYYRLTWNVRDNVGYCFLDAVYFYNSTNGNNVEFKVEAKDNASGNWVSVATGTIGNWPGHTYIPHTSLPAGANNATAGYYDFVRVTFSITSAAAYGTGFNLYSCEWWGGYPQGRRNVQWYDSAKNVWWPAKVYGTQFVDSESTGFYLDPGATSNLTGLTVANTITGSVSGNAGTVTNGVYTTGSYSDPSWLTLSKSKVGLSNVENTALSTWAGSSNITTLGTISSGTVPVARVSGLAASATTDTTNASNITSGTLPAARMSPTVAQSLRAATNISGGGTISVDNSYNVKWDARMIVISDGRGSNFATAGYWDINAPAAGVTITGVGGAANATVVSAGIPLGIWTALYYILPIGAGNGTVNANFRLVSYTTDVDIPHDWVLICMRNGDYNYVYFPNGIVLAAGQSSFNGLQSSTNVVNSVVKRDINGNFAANEISGSKFTDEGNTAYFLDPASTSDSGSTIRGGILHGPNTTWGKYLMVGGDGRQTYLNSATTASIVTTNGNLHIDAASDYDTYINYYDGTNLFVGAGDSSGSPRLQVFGSANYTQASGNLRAPLFYDSVNNSYYVDPDSTSNINSLVVNGGGTYYAANYFRNSAGPGAYLGSLNNPPLQAYSADNGPAFMSFHRGGQYAVNMGLDPDNVFRIGGWSASANRLQLNMSGDLTIAGSLTAGGTYVYTGSDTNYYLSAHSTSRLYAIRSDYFADTGGAHFFKMGQTSGTTRHLNLSSSSGDPSQAGSDCGISWGIRGDSNPYYMIMVRSENWNSSGNYTKLEFNWHTGIRIGASPSYGGTRFFNNSPGISGVSEIFSVGRGDSNVRVENVLYAGSFYDIAETSYYVDPNAAQGANLKYSALINGVGSDVGYGLAFYPSWTGSGTTVPTYGMMFAGTATYGTHGSVSNATDWAMYFTMNNSANRGWIFRDVSSAVNVASISNTGYARFASLGVGTNASGTAGEIRATDNVTAYYSDERLKTRLGKIENPIEKVKSLSGFYFAPNDTAMALGYQKKIDVGVSAQEVKEILPEIIAPAPIDPQYMTVRYEKLIPLLIEAIKAQQSQIEELQKKISELQPNK